MEKKPASLIPDTWQVPQRFRDRLGRQAGRPRAMFDSGHLLLILQDLGDTDQETPRARFFWKAPQQDWVTNGVTNALPALRRIVERFEDRRDTLARLVNEAQGADDWFSLLRTLSPLCRSARALHRALQEAREVAGDDRDLITLRDKAAEVEHDFDLMLTDAKFGLDSTIALRAEQQAATSLRIATSSHRLNLLMAFMLPLTAIGSVFGMNLPTGVERFGPAVFWVVAALSIFCGILVRSKIDPR